MKIKRNDRDEGFERFEYEPRWLEEFLSSRNVEEWCEKCPEQFSCEPPKRKPGTALYFAQYALMYMLWENYGIRSLTWLHIGAVNAKARALAGTHEWRPATPTGATETKRACTQAGWETMRSKMGDKFEVLQQAIVLSKPAFKPGHEGEPDLFCYTPDGTWFFAEAKSDKDNVLPSQIKWFDLAAKILPCEGQVFLCRVKEKGALGRPEHTARWNRVMGESCGFHRG